MFGGGKGAQKKKIKEFRDVTGASEKIATDLLKRFDNQVDEALDYYFAHPREYGVASSAKAPVDPAALEAVYAKYVDPDDPDALFGDGLRAFLIDLKINPDNTDALAVFWKLHASDVGELKKQEFVEGWSALGADSIPKMASIAQDIVSKTRPGESKEKMDQYRELYFWVFNYLKENKKKRTIPKDLGLSIWSIFFNSTNFPLVAPLAKFLSDHDQDHFTRDLWEMCFDFLRDTKADFSNFDPEGAWPVLIDSFVASFKK